MESMKDIRNRMVSVQKTMKITNAMFLMASSEMKRAKKNLAASEPYFNTLQKTISDILEHTHTAESKYFAKNNGVPDDEIKRGYIVITSDRGLAGSYNQNVIKLTESQLKRSKENTLMFIGSSGHNYFKKRPQLAKVDSENSFSAVKPALFRARGVAEHVVGEYNSGNLNEVYVVYTKMLNALSAEAEIIKLLPMSRDMFPHTDTGEDESADTYEELYDPSPEAVLDQIVPNYVKGLIYGAMIEAYASEQNARMTAMDNATENAKEIAQKLSLLYNRVRQAAITTELIEVVGGANAQDE